MNAVPVGLCQCGCGQKTKLVQESNAGRGWVKGEPFRFLRGHARKGKGRRQYPRIPSAGEWQYVHRVRAEQALGKPLPALTEVHHVNGTKDSGPLVICQDGAYHRLLHARTRIVKAGGNPNTDALCYKCKCVKPRAEFSSRRTRPSGIKSICRICSAEVCRQWRAARSISGLCL